MFPDQLFVCFQPQMFDTIMRTSQTRRVSSVVLTSPHFVHFPLKKSTFAFLFCLFLLFILVTSLLMTDYFSLIFLHFFMWIIHECTPPPKHTCRAINEFSQWLSSRPLRGQRLSERGPAAISKWVGFPSFPVFPYDTMFRTELKELWTSTIQESCSA